MCSLVYDELDKLTKEDVKEFVQFSDWAAPILLVLKRDKTSVRICGNFIATTVS